MATRGRNICNTLKAIRKQIADANGINYSPEECHFEGECKGTCPKCEQDVKDLEYELRLRQMAGKAIKVAGVALGITALATSCSTQKGYYNSAPSLPEKIIPIHFQDYTPNDSILLKEKEKLCKKGVLFVQGHLIDEENKEPLIGAFVTAKLSGKHAIADVDGNFTLEVEQGDTITVKYIGYQDRIIKLSEMSQEKLNIITLPTSGGLLGEIVVVKKGKHSKKAKQEKKSKQGKTAIIQPAIGADSTESREIFGIAEEMPVFPGGQAALMKYIKDNLHYPKEYLEGAVTGRVIVGFTVNEDGSVSDVKVMRSVTPELDKEAVRVVKSMPKWTPGKLEGKVVKVKYTVPVSFRLE